MENMQVRNLKKVPFTQIENDILDSTAFQKPIDKLLYITLHRFDYGYAQSTIMPSIPRLAKMCGVSRGTIFSSLDRLEKMQLVKRENRKKEDGGNTSNIYWLLEIPQEVLENNVNEEEKNPSSKIELPPSKNCTTPVQKLNYPSSKIEPEEEELKNTSFKKNSIKNLEEEDKSNSAQIDEIAFDEFKSEYQELINDDMFTNIKNEMIKTGLTIFTIQEARRQIKRMNSNKDKGRVIHDWANYFIGGIIKNRLSEEQALAESLSKKLEAEAKQKQEETNQVKTVPLYNWLENNDQIRKLEQ